MKKNIIVIYFIIGLLYLYPAIPVYASNLCPPGWESLCKISIENNTNIVGGIVQLLIVFAISLSVLFMIWGGVKYIMSKGDKNSVEQARSTIIASVVGLIISLIAYFIISLVVYLFTGKSGIILIIPKLV